MNHLDYWKDNLLQKEIQKNAYHSAITLISSFPSKLASASYFRSLAERMSTYETGGIELFIEELKEERSRNKVKKYWGETSHSNKTLYEEIHSLVSDKSLGILRRVGNSQNVDLTTNKPLMAKYHFQFVYYYFFYLANLVDLNNEVLEENNHVKSS